MKCCITVCVQQAYIYYVKRQNSAWNTWESCFLLFECVQTHLYLKRYSSSSRRIIQMCILLPAFSTFKLPLQVQRCTATAIQEIQSHGHCCSVVASRLCATQEIYLKKFKFFIFKKSNSGIPSSVTN